MKSSIENDPPRTKLVKLDIENVSQSITWVKLKSNINDAAAPEPEGMNRERVMLTQYTLQSAH